MLEQLPQSLQHQDAGRKNLASRVDRAGQTTTVPIDWGFVGLNAIGGELGCLLVSSSRWFGGVTPDQLPELETLLFDAYMDGLQDQGCDYDAHTVRLGYLLTSVLMFGSWWVRYFANPTENLRETVETTFGRSLDEITHRWSEVNRYVVTLAEEARSLI